MFFPSAWAEHPSEIDTMHHLTLGSFSVQMWQCSSSAEDYEEIFFSVHMKVLFLDLTKYVTLQNCEMYCMGSDTLLQLTFTHFLSSLKALWFTIYMWTSKLSCCPHTTSDCLCSPVHVLWLYFFSSFAVWLCFHLSECYSPSVVFTLMPQLLLPTYVNFELFFSFFSDLSFYILKLV